MSALEALKFARTEAGVKVKPIALAGEDGWFWQGGCWKSDQREIGGEFRNMIAESEIIDSNGEPVEWEILP